MNVFASALMQPLPIPKPPVEFDIKLDLLKASRAAVLAAAVHGGQLDGFYCQGQLWVRRGDIHDLLPPGHCTSDPDDQCCFIPS